MSPQIQTVHFYSPKNNTFAAIEEQFNFQYPFGKEWNGIYRDGIAAGPANL